MRKLTRKGLKKKVDQAFKGWMKENKVPACITCSYWDRMPALENLHWGHLITATLLATRYDPMNVEWQCDTCNYMHEFRPEKYTQWFIDKYGYQAYKDLERRSRTSIGNYDKFYKDKLIEFNV